MSFRVCSSPKSRRSGLESHRTWITPPNLSEPAQTSAIHADLTVKYSNLIYSHRLEQIPQSWGNLTDLVKPLTRGCRGSCDRYSASKVEEYSCCVRIGVHTWHFRKISFISAALYVQRVRGARQAFPGGLGRKLNSRLREMWETWQFIGESNGS